MSENQTFTVFVDEVGDIPGFWGSKHGQSLAETIAAAVGHERPHLGKLTPTAWAPGQPSREKCWQDLHAESIAAGRIIENVNGTWVARGVEEAPAEEREFAPIMTELLRRADLGLLAVRPSDDEPRPALEWSKPSRIDRFPGFVVRGDIATPAEPIHPLSQSPDLQKSGHQVAAGHALAAVKFG